MNVDKTIQAISMLTDGLAQKTVARRVGLTVKDVRKIAHEFGVGRKPGQTRNDVRKSNSFMDMLGRFETRS